MEPGREAGTSYEGLNEWHCQVAYLGARTLVRAVIRVHCYLATLSPLQSQTRSLGIHLSRVFGGEGDKNNKLRWEKGGTANPIFPYSPPI